MVARLWGGGAAVCLVGLAVLSVPRTGPVITIAGALVVAALVLTAVVRRFLVLATGAAAAVSLTATGLLAVSPPPPLHNTAAAWLLAELAALLVLLAIVLRRTESRRAAYVTLFAVLAATALPMRVAVDSAPPASVLELAVLGGLGVLPAVAAVLAGGYLRVLDGRRVRAVAETRAAQRRRLAYDLHDFVGHDLNAIVLEAQAALLVPGRARDALARIEEAGQAALSAMDQTLRMLAADAVGGDERGMGITDLDQVVGRFGEWGPARPRLRVEEVGPVPREVGAVVYRIVVESLTNVRRHAPDATEISVEVTAVPGPAVCVSVTDDGHHVSGPGPRRGRGLGIVGLTEHVELLGGRLTAGRRQPSGWQVVATIPTATVVRS
nr:ATP-binding protein [Kibdelosporangium sp. MJ126-NF4]ADB02869.1 AzicR4 [Kibdelosporangium sp. MJ126-NF4]CEL14083.1 Two-component system sensor kinase [Kibdelosporangium sp. MJ126-NF4]CTQ88449.1 Two-component system sensor kinase [Kibdelosporangium sp. MJ126-NF4]